MPGAEAWQAFGGVVAIVIFLGAGVVGLRRIGILGGGAKPVPAASDADKAGHVSRTELERAIADLRLHVSENYVRRDDYIPNESRVIGLLENHSVMLARLEERIGAQT